MARPAFNTRDRAALAERLFQRGVPRAREFQQAWTSFNTCYNTAGSGGSERDRVLRGIRRYVNDADAAALLPQLDASIRYFSHLPPGDTRRSANDPSFRQTATEDLQIVNDPASAPAERLARLMGVIYQIRCNLAHGDKDPDVLRDRELVHHSVEVINQVVPLVIRSMR
ncbi:MAG TPA: hypothetical protein VF584_24270 [Longimicrobium sp.]|jgi:hypothetical protein